MNYWSLRIARVCIVDPAITKHYDFIVASVSLPEVGDVLTLLSIPGDLNFRFDSDEPKEITIDPDTIDRLPDFSSEELQVWRVGVS
ncbi:MAG: hypothetical protein V4727_14660 [Verrucomicrobiota bacterium]